MAIEEDWHGHPMIDERNSLAVVAALVVIASFVLGGVIAGYRRPAAALRHAAVAGAIAAGVLTVAAVFRRVFLVHEGVSGAVALLWLSGIVAALIFSSLGSQLGRKLAPGLR